MTFRSPHPFTMWLAAGLAALLAAGGVHAQQRQAPPAQQAPREIREIAVQQNSGELIQLPAPATSVLVANPDIADVQAPTATTLMVFGRKPGRTSIYALGASGQALASLTVRVTHDLGDLRALLGAQTPNSTISVTSTPQGIVLGGSAPTPAEALRIRDLTKRFINKDDEVIDNMTVSGATQVNLRVRVAEVSRQATKRLGFNWQSLISNGTFAIGLLTGRAAVAPAVGALASATQGALFGTSAETPTTISGGLAAKNLSINQALDLLASDGLVTILAEPNITAISGEQSSFLAGGEFPIPISTSNNTIGIEFKRFGVSIDFNPTVLSRDRISMKVRPEVSELSDRGAITTQGGLRIPALSVRRAETTIELGSGQSFAIAGLFSNNMNTELARTPGIGDVPILGALFRSDRFQRAESELVIIVTPYIVRPSSERLGTPADGVRVSDDAERLFEGRIIRNNQPTGARGPINADGMRLGGDAGFMME
ncbi:MAG: type II and III secretion system protein family protein [Alphaproteobacteria bacterium]|nr:type II and III secretion system protein family protein [Alphaproteobacteria bacterium]